MSSAYKGELVEGSRGCSESLLGDWALPGPGQVWGRPRPQAARPGTVYSLSDYSGKLRKSARTDISTTFEGKKKRFWTNTEVFEMCTSLVSNRYSIKTQVFPRFVTIEVTFRFSLLGESQWYYGFCCSMKEHSD